MNTNLKLTAEAINTDAITIDELGRVVILDHELLEEIAGAEMAATFSGDSRDGNTNYVACPTNGINCRP